MDTIHIHQSFVLPATNSLKATSVDVDGYATTNNDSLHNVLSVLKDSLVEHGRAIDHLAGKVDDISTYGVGFDDTISVIAIPLIIALFAFAFPFLFTVITHINNKYDSKDISELFEQTKSYLWFWRTTKLSIIFLIIYGVLSLLRVDIVHYWLYLVGPWFGLFIASIYSFAIFKFVKTCISFNTPTKLLDYVDGDCRKGLSNAEKEIANSKKKVRYLPKHFVIDLYIERLIAIALYALQKSDNNLFSNVLLRMNGVAKREKTERKTAMYQPNKGVKTKEGSFYTQKFFKAVIDYYQNSSQDLKLEERLILSPIFSLDKSLFPSETDIYGLMGSVYRAALHGHVTLFAKYIDVVTYGYSQIYKMPDMAYVIGEDEEGQKGTLETAKTIWHKFRSMLYILAADLYGRGNYEALDAILYNKRYDSGRLLPKFGAEVLQCYHRSRDLYKSDKYSDMYVKIIVGENRDPDLLEKYTAARILLLNHDENEHGLYASEKELCSFRTYKETLLAYAKRAKSDADFIRHYPQAAITDFEPVFDSICNDIEHCTDLKEGNLYDTAIESQTEAGFKNQMQDMLRNIDGISEGINGILAFTPTNEVQFGKYILYVKKFMFFDIDNYILHSVIKDYEGIFVSRYRYLLYSALTAMKKRRVKMNVAQVETYVKKELKGHEDEYVLIDTGNAFEYALMPDIVMHPLYNYKGVAYYYIEKEMTPITDLLPFQIFDGTLVVVKRSQLPVLMYETDGKLANVDLLDMSNKVEGVLDVKVSIVPNLKMVYDCHQEIMVIEHERMAV